MIDVLKLSSGNIIVIKINDINDKDRIEKIKESILIECEEFDIKEVQFLVLNTEESIITMNESDMNHLGWYRKERNYLNNKLIKRGNLSIV